MAFDFVTVSGEGGEPVIDFRERVVAEKEIRYSYKGLLRLSPNVPDADGVITSGTMRDGEVYVPAGVNFVSDSDGNATTLELYTNAARVSNLQALDSVTVGSATGDHSLRVDAVSRFLRDAHFEGAVTDFSTHASFLRAEGSSLHFGTANVPLDTPALDEILVGDGNGDYVLKNIRAYIPSIPPGGVGGGVVPASILHYGPVMKDGSLLALGAFDVSAEDGAFASCAVLALGPDGSAERYPVRLERSPLPELQPVGALETNLGDRVAPSGALDTLPAEYGDESGVPSAGRVMRGWFCAPVGPEGGNYIVELVREDGSMLVTQLMHGSVAAEERYAAALSDEIELSRHADGTYSAEVSWELGRKLALASYGGAAIELDVPGEGSTRAWVDGEGRTVTGLRRTVFRGLADGVEHAFRVESRSVTGAEASDEASAETPALLPAVRLVSVRRELNADCTTNIVYHWDTSASETPIVRAALSVSKDGSPVSPRPFDVSGDCFFTLYRMGAGEYAATVEVEGANGRKASSNELRCTVEALSPAARVLYHAAEPNREERDGTYDTTIFFTDAGSPCKVERLLLTVTGPDGYVVREADVTGQVRYRIPSLPGDASYTAYLRALAAGGASSRSEDYTFELKAGRPHVMLRSNPLYCCCDTEVPRMLYEWDDFLSGIRIERFTLKVWDDYGTLFYGVVDGYRHIQRIFADLDTPYMVYAQVEAVSIQGVRFMSNIVEDELCCCRGGGGWETVYLTGTVYLEDEGDITLTEYTTGYWTGYGSESVELTEYPEEEVSDYGSLDVELSEYPEEEVSDYGSLDVELSDYGDGTVFWDDSLYVDLSEYHEGSFFWEDSVQAELSEYHEDTWYGEDSVYADLSDFWEDTWYGEDSVTVELSHYGDGTVFWDDSLYVDLSEFWEDSAYGEGSVDVELSIFWEEDYGEDGSAAVELSEYGEGSAYGDGSAAVELSEFGEGSAFGEGTVLTTLSWVEEARETLFDTLSAELSEYGEDFWEDLGSALIELSEYGGGEWSAFDSLEVELEVYQSGYYSLFGDTPLSDFFTWSEF